MHRTIADLESQDPRNPRAGFRRENFFDAQNNKRCAAAVEEYGISKSRIYNVMPTCPKPYLDNFIFRDPLYEIPKGLSEKDKKNLKICVTDKPYAVGTVTQIKVDNSVEYEVAIPKFTKKKDGAISKCEERHTFYSFSALRVYLKEHDARLVTPWRSFYPGRKATSSNSPSRSTTRRLVGNHLPTTALTGILPPQSEFPLFTLLVLLLVPLLFLVYIFTRRSATRSDERDDRLCRNGPSGRVPV